VLFFVLCATLPTFVQGTKQPPIANAREMKWFSPIPLEAYAAFHGDFDVAVASLDR
jgi:hypothetical protein